MSVRGQSKTRRCHAFRSLVGFSRFSCPNRCAFDLGCRCCCLLGVCLCWRGLCCCWRGPAPDPEPSAASKSTKAKKIIKRAQATYGGNTARISGKTASLPPIAGVDAATTDAGGERVGSGDGTAAAESAAASATTAIVAAAAAVAALAAITGASTTDATTLKSKYAVLNYCPYCYDLVDVMGDCISTNPTGSYSTSAPQQTLMLPEPRFLGLP
ncbi:hypothetical protein CF326_g8997 [Tilletia indica]|nr:hypothetical protein CF326_g8997 [Tilletia indica]